MTAYLAPAGLAEALDALARGARPVAGGTDLVVGARQGKAPLPDDLVALHRLGALRGIVDGPDGGLVLGAGTAHATIVADARCAGARAGLADASAIVGSHATRVTGTLGGNLANASPAADTVAPLLCMDAVLVLRSVRGERRVPLDGFATGPRRTSLAADELIVAVELPALPAASGTCYVRLEYRRQMEIAVVGAGARVTLADGRVTEARVAMAALAPTVRRVPEAEAALVGTDGGPAAVAAAADALAAAARPIDDVRASAAYRRAMAAVVARRAIGGALTRARGDLLAVPASDTLFGAR
ncbi:MAG: FAD binding domain-containing protein [Chloroflexota bacterium]